MDMISYLIEHHEECFVLSRQTSVAREFLRKPFYHLIYVFFSS
jgi:hypothetical protein